MDLSSSLCNKLPESKYDQVEIGDDPLVCFMAGKSKFMGHFQLAMELMTGW